MYVSETIIILENEKEIAKIVKNYRDISKIVPLQPSERQLMVCLEDDIEQGTSNVLYHWNGERWQYMGSNLEKR